MGKTKSELENVTAFLELAQIKLFKNTKRNLRWFPWVLYGKIHAQAKLDLGQFSGTKNYQIIDKIDKGALFVSYYVGFEPSTSGFGDFCSTF